MKLLRCHIENFGKFHRADFNFDEGITQFCYENGYGKTTLAAFLKAMFYGLPSYKSNTTKFNDRMHFYPFDGGKFGGSLTFEMKGKEYRVERYFDRKSDTEDELTVYCGGAPYDFGTEIGRAVFGLDKESFERTAFYHESDSDLCATSGIGERLNRFVEHTEDEVGFDAAADALERAKKNLKKGRGAGGRMDDVQGEISALVKEIENLEQIGAALSGYYARRKTLREEIAAAEEKIAEARNKNLVFEKWKHYDSLLARRREALSAAEEIKDDYPAGVPSREDLARAKNEAENVNRLRAVKARYVFPDAKMEKLGYFDRMFAAGVPDEETLAKVGNGADEVKSLDAKIAAGAAEKDERFRRLEQKFKDNLPSGDAETRAAERVEEYRGLQQCPVSDGGAQPKKKSLLFPVLALLAVAIAAAGVGLIFVNVIVGGVLIGVGAVGLGAVAFLYLKRQSVRVQDAENAKRIARMQAAENAVREFLAPYGYFTQNGVAFDFGTYQNEKREYLEKERALREGNARTAELERRRGELGERLQRFFDGYRLGGEDFLNALALLKQRIAEYASLQAEEREFEKNQTASQAEVERSLAAVKQIYGKYAIGTAPSSEHIEKMIKDAETLKRLEREAAGAQTEAEEYRIQNGLKEKPLAEETDVAPLNGELADKRSELAAVERHISDAEADTERLADKKAKKEALQEEYERLKERYGVLSAALDCLKEADRNLKDKYVAPVRQTYLKYADAIESMLGEKVSMDAEFRISFERGGQQRADRFLSAGQRSVCALCFRLALMENMYGAEKPFLVLDDPFAELDEGHFEKTAKTLTALAKDVQIIYFCCHASRKVI